MRFGGFDDGKGTVGNDDGSSQILWRQIWDKSADLKLREGTMERKYKEFFAKHKVAAFFVVIGIVAIFGLTMSNRISGRFSGSGAAGADLIQEMKAIYGEDYPKKIECLSKEGECEEWEYEQVQYTVEPIREFRFGKKTTFGKAGEKLGLEDLGKIAECFEIEIPQDGILDNQPIGKSISGALYKVTATFTRWTELSGAEETNDVTVSNKRVVKEVTHYGINPYENSVRAMLIDGGHSEGEA